MVKLNSNTAILSDLDGVILNLDYDIKFWESRLPEHLSSQSNQSLEEIKTKIHAEIDIQRGTLNFYDLNYWDDLLNVCLLYTSPSPRDATLSRMPSSA